MRTFFQLLTITYILIILFSTGCRTKNDVIAPERDSLGKINQWIYDSMRYYYYWSSGMPAQPDYGVTPELFFKELQNSEDRFSAISNRTGITVGRKTAFSLYGFHYAIVQHVASGAYIGIVTYVAQESPAYRAGLRRGTCFTKVADTPLSAERIAWADALLSSTTTIRLTVADLVNEVWTEQKTVNVNSTYFTENPVVLTKYFSRNGVKTGYLLYVGFDETYDIKLLTAFSKMKQAGVAECIIDLRFNAGGSVATCAKMTGLLSGVREDDVFGIFSGNSRQGRQTYTMSRILKTSSNTSGSTFTELTANRLSLKRIYVLTSRATASAAELLVNNLKPYLPVIQIGDTTLGKDEAGFEVYDQRNPKQVQWILQLIVYKLFNAAGNGGYNKGLKPDFQVNEVADFPLPALGAADDPLINKALQLIYGQDITDEQTLRKQRMRVLVPLFVSAGRYAESMPPALLKEPY